MPLSKNDAIASLTYVGNGSNRDTERVLRALVDGDFATGTPASAIPDPTGTATDEDVEARAAIVAILGVLRAKGIIAT